MVVKLITMAPSSLCHQLRGFQIEKISQWHVACEDIFHVLIKKLKQMMGAHPSTQQHSGLEHRLTNLQSSILTMQATTLPD